MLQEVEQKHGQNCVFAEHLFPPPSPPKGPYPFQLIQNDFQVALRLGLLWSSFMDASLSSDNKFISRLGSSLVDDMMTIIDIVFTTYYWRQAAARSWKKIIVQQGSKI